MSALPSELLKRVVFSRSNPVSPCVSSGTQPEVLPKLHELLESKSQTISLACSILRGRAQNGRLRGGDVRAKITFKKMMAEVPETKLVKVLIIALTEKNSLMKRHCVGQTFIVYCRNREATTLQQKSNIFKLFSTGVKLYFSSTSNNVQLIDK